MGSCFSGPTKSSRRRHSRSCAPVQYEYYYSTRDGEVVLVRHRIEQPQRYQHCESEASSSLNVNIISGHGNRHHRTKSQRKKKKKSKSSHRKSRIRGSHGAGSVSEDEEWQREENRNQVAFWAGESTRGHDSVSPGGVDVRSETCGQENRDGSIPGDILDDNVSSLDENDDVEVVDEPETLPEPQKS
ncbi:hypothetical protein ACHAQJ_004655 [Trichoderma viride]